MKTIPVRQVACTNAAVGRIENADTTSSLNPTPMKNLVYFHTYNQQECLRRVAELVRQNYRIERIVIRDRAAGGVICRVKAHRSVMGYLMCLVREVRRLSLPTNSLLEASGTPT
jgi:hypothetical protein